MKFFHPCAWAVSSALLSLVIGCSSSPSDAGGAAGSGGNSGATTTVASGGPTTGSVNGTASSSGAETGGAGTGGAGGVGGSAASVGTGGAQATCGNGVIEPGENCDGNDLNQATCTSLGFDAGTLGCLATCHFDTSACTSALKVTVNASRTSCTAPCAVFFDATGTTGLMGDDYVIANFNWDFDSTNMDPTGVHEQTIGFLAGHVFDAPGTYQVAVRVRDAAGKSGTTTIPITVSPMSGTTYYVASSGKDSNAGTSMSAPFATLDAAMAHAGPNVSVRLRKGDTFKLNSTINLATMGPFLVGDYADPSSPSNSAPILSSSAGNLVVTGNGQDMRFTDVHLVSTNASGAQAFTFQGGTNTLIERVEIEGLAAAGSENFSVTADASKTFIVDCHAHDFMGYGLYAVSNVLAIIGNTLEKFGGQDHGFRIASGASTYIAENTVMASSMNGGAFSGITIRGDDKNIVVVDNHVNRLIEFTPQNTQAVEHVSDGLAEGNVIDDADLGVSYTALGITAQHIVARNNVLIDAPIAISVAGQPQLPINYVDRIFVYNNTSYFFSMPTFSATFVSHSSTTGSLVAQNNLFAEGGNDSNGVSTFLGADGMGTEVVNHNIMFAPNGNNVMPGSGAILADPKFASTDLTSPNALHLSLGSPAIDTGVMVPVYQDLAGVLRPAGAGWDIGAFEFTP